MHGITEELVQMWAMLTVMFAFGGIWTPVEACICAEMLPPPNLPPDQIDSWEREQPGRLVAWTPGRPAD